MKTRDIRLSVYNNKMVKEYKNTLARRIEPHIINLITADPTVSNKELADLFDCALSTIRKAREKAELVVSENTERLVKLRQYRDIFSDKFNIQERAEALIGIAKLDPQGSNRIAALNKIDALDGLGTRVLDNDPATPEPRPLFNLPEGATVNVSIHPTKEPDAIDITPQVIDSKEQ